MTKADVEMILQRACARARETFSEARPRITSDNGPQFIAKSFKEHIRICGMTHVRTSPYYPQSNGKTERWHRSLKSECIRPTTPLSLADAQRVARKSVAVYNTQRLQSAIGYVTLQHKLGGREGLIFSERNCKLLKHAPAGDNRFIQRVFRSVFLMVQARVRHMQHSALFTGGETPVHAEPIQLRT